MLHILHGDDTFSINEHLGRLRSALFSDATLADLNVTEFDGRSLTSAELQHHTAAIPFLAEKRLAIVHHYLTSLATQPPAAPALQALTVLWEGLPPTTELVFAESSSLPAKHPMLQKAQELGASITLYSQPRGEALIEWLATHAKQHGGAIEEAAARELIQAVGEDLRMLDSELGKLLAYVDWQRAVTVEDVKLLASYVERSQDFGLLNAIGRRDGRRASKQLHSMLAEGQHPLAILAMISNQVRSLLEMHEYLERRMSAAQIARAKGWRSSFPAERRMQEARLFTPTFLEAILLRMAELDAEIKSGQIQDTLALELLVAGLCRVR